MRKEQLISKIRQIVKEEKFRLDAYFFCGFPAGKPNSRLLKACEDYLEAVEKGRQEEEVTIKLVAALEAAVTEKEKMSNIDNLMDNISEIQTILAHKEYLW